jgi:hypothetical protein
MRWRVLAFAAAAALAGCTSNLTIGGVSTAGVVHRSQLPPAPAGYVASLGASGQQEASLAVLSGAASVTVSAAALPGQLLRAWTPTGSSIRPELVVVNGTVQVYLGGTGHSGPDTVWIQVSSAVRWRLQFSGGASQTSVQMSNGAVDGIDFTAGSSLITMQLPEPAGTVPVTLAGGASQVNISLPKGVPARLRLYGGASLAMLGGRAYSGVSGGKILTGPGWSAAANRYDFAAPAGVSLISVSG